MPLAFRFRVEEFGCGFPQEKIINQLRRNKTRRVSFKHESLTN
jgi:hypothetical protein